MEDPPPSTPTSGSLRILADNGIGTPPSPRLLLLRNGATLTRAVDLSGATSASVEVHYRRHSLSGFVLIQSTVDGSAWVDAISIDAGTDAAYQVASADIPVGSTSIRFLHQPGGFLLVDQITVHIISVQDPERPRPQIHVSGALQRLVEVEGGLQRIVEVPGALQRTIEIKGRLS